MTTEFDAGDLDAFRSSGVDVADLSERSDIGDWEGAGRVYLDALVIQRDAQGYCLTIGNSSHYGELPDLEAELYEWAAGEGFFDPPKA